MNFPIWAILTGILGGINFIEAGLFESNQEVHELFQAECQMVPDLEKTIDHDLDNRVYLGVICPSTNVDLDLAQITLPKGANVEMLKQGLTALPVNCTGWEYQWTSAVSVICERR